MGMMKEQMKSMIGMVSMFVITILLALFIRPWYDVGELHAFGESGATQVRFIFSRANNDFHLYSLCYYACKIQKRLVNQIRYNGCFNNRIDVYYNSSDAYAGN